MQSSALRAIATAVTLAACARDDAPLSADAAIAAAAIRVAPDAAFGPPPGYVTAHVLGVHATDAGDVVLLAESNDPDALVLPIFVGGTEALTIRLRHAGAEYARPLTHDLLAALATRLGAHPLEARVDELRGSTYVGSVLVRQGARVLELDARPSDAIAFALGSGAPIYVARALLESSGIPKKDIDVANPERSVRRPKDPTWL